LNDNRAPHYIQQHSSPEVVQLLWCSPLHDGVELQAAASKSCRRRQYPNRRQPDTTAGHQKMIRTIRWLGSGHASPDVHADDVWLRLNSALSEGGESGLVGDLRNRHHGTVVQEKVQVPRKANGYHGVVPTAEVVVSLQDNVNKPADPDGHYECWTRAVGTVRAVGGDSGRMSDTDNSGLGTGRS